MYEKWLIMVCNYLKISLLLLNKFFFFWKNFFLGSGCDIEFKLDNQNKKQTESHVDGKSLKQYIYYDGEDVSGTVS